MQQRKRELATTLAYLLGVRKELLVRYYHEEECGNIIRELEKNQNATKIRYLSKLRTTLFTKYARIDSEIRYHLSNLDRMECIDKENLKQLKEWGINIVKANHTAEKYTTDITELINTHIDSIADIIPEWLPFEYVKALFKVSTKNIQKEIKKFKKNITLYPFQVYINWNPEDIGNILDNDEKLTNIIYKQNGKEFTDVSKTRDASLDTKEDIYSFIENGEKVNIIVDCENSDVFKLYGVLKNLKAEYLSRINKITLYDDVNTSTAWGWLEKFFNTIPVERVMVDRINNHKSLVDIKMTAGTCKDYYTDNVDSFILCSSDSDFWALISSLPKAKFLVMYEYEKCGKVIKEAMETYNIKNCAIDDFYTGNATNLKKAVLLSKLEEFLPIIIGMNARDLTKQLYAETNIRFSEKDIEDFYNRYIATLKLKINESGEFYVRIEK